jgi:phosphatidylserine/phosphatidylglycerophosphate/cardiolipin synthase-like enzyme
MNVVHDPAVQGSRGLVSAATQTVDVGGLGVESLAPPASDWPRAPEGIIRGPMRVHTFVSPDCSFRAMRELLGRARRSLLIYVYNASSDDMLRLVSDAMGRGVSVRIMYDRTAGMPWPMSAMCDALVTLLALRGADSLAPL